jgi:hypothetical protein
MIAQHPHLVPEISRKVDAIIGNSHG